MTKRTLLLVLAAVAACVAVVLVVHGGGDDANATAASTAAAPRAVAQRAVPPAIPGAPSPSHASRAYVHADGEVIEDDKEYPVDPKPPTREEPLTEEQRDPRQKRAIEMLDQAVVRAEARLAAAEAAGDTAAATTARVRIKRLKEVREKRVNEVGATP